MKKDHRFLRYCYRQRLITSENLKYYKTLSGTEMKGKIEINQELCKGCELCIHFCPKKLITLSENLNMAGYLPSEFKETKECTGCATCATVCPEVAIEVYRG